MLRLKTEAFGIPLYSTNCNSREKPGRFSGDSAKNFEDFRDRGMLGFLAKRPVTDAAP
jgi:hypothetical protein